MTSEAPDSPAMEHSVAPDNAAPEATSVQDAQSQYDTLNNQYLRLAADFDNFRKRQAQEREFLLKYGAQSTLESLMPVLDNLARARQSLTLESEPKLLLQSFDMLAQQLLTTLQDAGLKELTPQGELFDPEKHEAISQVEKQDVPDHTILEVYQSGFMLHDRVIRPARVVVAVNSQQQSLAENFQPAQDGSNPFQQPNGQSLGDA